MVLGQKINGLTVGGVTVSVLKATDPPKNHHDDSKVEVGDEWVCVGGGRLGHHDGNDDDGRR